MKNIINRAPAAEKELTPQHVWIKQHSLTKEDLFQ